MVFFLLTTSLFTISFTFTIITYAEGPRDIFILAGQSNMAGRGGVVHGLWNGFVPPEAQPAPNILRLDSRNVWVQAHEPLHVDIDIGKTCGVGPGMAFSHAIQSLGGSGFGVIGLVPCAVGGTKIDQWVRGGGLYDRMMARIKTAMEGGGKVRAMLWYQGESDTVKIEDAKTYKGKMETLVLNLRSDLNDSSLLVIQVALASGEGRYVDIVRRSQLSLNMPRVKCVDAKGLSSGPDHLHLTTMSQVHLGYMLARAFLDITPNNLDGSVDYI